MSETTARGTETHARITKLTIDLERVIADRRCDIETMALIREALAILAKENMMTETNPLAITEDELTRLYHNVWVCGGCQ